MQRQDGADYFNVLTKLELKDLHAIRNSFNFLSRKKKTVKIFNKNDEIA